MENKIKLIWDFRGDRAALMAKHHKIHLDEYLLSITYKIQITGTETYDDFFSIAYMVINESDKIEFRDILRPHRAEVYDEKF
jgi:hypothetical protein